MWIEVEHGFLLDQPYVVRGSTHTHNRIGAVSHNFFSTPLLREAPVAVVKVLARLKVLSRHQVLLGVRAERLDRHGPVRGALAIIVGVGDANLPADQTPAHLLGLGVSAPGFLRLLLVLASSPCYERNCQRDAACYSRDPLIFIFQTIVDVNER